MRFLILLHFTCACFFLAAQNWQWDLNVPFSSSRKLIKSINGEVYEMESQKFTRLDKWGQPEITLTFPQSIELAGLAADNQHIWLLSNSVDANNNTSTLLSEYDRGGKLQWTKTVTGKYFYLGNRGTAIVLRDNRLLITGVLCSDTVNFLGTIIARNLDCHAYVAECYQNGVLIRINSIRSAYLTPDTMPESFPIDLCVDERGNSYLYAFCRGRAVIGPDTIDARFYESRHLITKLDPQLHVQYMKVVYGHCDWLCYPPKNMRVNSRGEILMLSQYNYGQSGNDDEYTSLFRFKSNGVLDTIISLTAKGTIRSMDIDSCDNLVMTGYERNEANSIPFKSWMKTFELDPNLGLTWQVTDTSAHEGYQILSLSRREIFVKGLFSDSVKLKSTFYAGPGGVGGYYATLGLSADRCSSVLDVKALSSGAAALKCYPNPAYGELNIESEQPSTYNIRNSLGQEIRSGTIQKGITQISLTLPPGVYFITFEKSRSTKKILVN